MSLGKEFWEAVDRGELWVVKENYWGWKDRKDLLDDVIAKGVDFTVRFIQRVEMQKTVYLLHSLIRVKR